MTPTPLRPSDPDSPEKGEGWTKGPWRVAKRAQRRVTSERGVIICNAVLRNQGGPKAKTCLKDEHEAEANANLIAAAPDLYAALAWAERAIAPFSKEPQEKSGINMIRAALRRARGEP